MKRKLNWQADLLSFMNSLEDTPFDWGKHDCCLLAADAVVAMTGEDFATPFRGRYSTEAEANACLAEYGGLIAYIDSVLTQKDVNFAQFGDVVLVTTDLGPTLGIYWSLDRVWLHAPDGVKLFPRMKNKITHIWGV